MYSIQSSCTTFPGGQPPIICRNKRHNLFLNLISKSGYFSIACLLLSGILLTSCKTKTPEITNPADTGKVIAPDQFDYNTTKQVDVSIQLLAGDNKPLAGVTVAFHDSNNGVKDQLLLNTNSDKNGQVKLKLTVPVYLDTVIIHVPFVGVVQNIKGYISGNAMTGTIGGTKGYSGNLLAYEVNDPTETDVTNQPSAATYTYMGDFDLKNGSPKYKEESGDVITAPLLAYINASLPEELSVSKSHPQYLLPNTNNTLKIIKQTDVWITFVGEGTSNSNALGFYTYATATPPTSISDVKQVTYILPNASFIGSGGAMFLGDKVKLGKFEAGTSIGFVFIKSGWQAGKVNQNAQKWYSDDVLNNEGVATSKRHSVLLYENAKDIFLIGFEGMRREDKKSDMDFNDVVVYASTSTPGSISSENVNPGNNFPDTDSDGISDYFDQFPTDASRAFVQYLPSEKVWGTLAFEDQWPNVGDYDLNDLVVGYRYMLVNNALNQTVELTGSYMIRAVGATYNNGFGVELPMEASSITAVSGQRISGTTVQLAGNGVEIGQTKAVIIPFDKTSAVIKTGYVNTNNSSYHITGDTVQVKVTFKSPVPNSTFSKPPFNPFLIVNQKRGYEVHLPNQTPTEKADKTLLGTLSDNSNATKGIYYVSRKNWPFGLSFYEPFDYPLETQSINKGYLHFFDWTGSGGKNYTDWYKNLKPGYRNNDFIYKK